MYKIKSQLKVAKHCFSLFLLFSTLYINSEDTEIMTEQIWNYVVNKNVVHNPEY